MTTKQKISSEEASLNTLLEIWNGMLLEAQTLSDSSEASELNLILTTSVKTIQDLLESYQSLESLTPLKRERQSRDLKDLLEKSEKDLSGYKRIEAKQILAKLKKEDEETFAKAQLVESTKNIMLTSSLWLTQVILTPFYTKGEGEDFEAFQPTQTEFRFYRRIGGEEFIRIELMTYLSGKSELADRFFIEGTIPHSKVPRVLDQHKVVSITKNPSDFSNDQLDALIQFES